MSEVPLALSKKDQAQYLVRSFVFGEGNAYKQGLYLVWLDQRAVMELNKLNPDELRTNQESYALLMTAFLRVHNWFNGPEHEQWNHGKEFNEAESAERLFQLIKEAIQDAQKIVEKGHTFLDTSLEELVLINAFELTR